MQCPAQHLPCGRLPAIVQGDSQYVARKSCVGDACYVCHTTAEVSVGMLWSGYPASTSYVNLVELSSDLQLYNLT